MHHKKREQERNKVPHPAGLPSEEAPEQAPQTEEPPFPEAPPPHPEQGPPVPPQEQTLGIP